MLIITLYKYWRFGCVEPKEVSLMCSELWGTTSNRWASFSVRNDCWDPSSNSRWASACIFPFTMVAIAVFNKQTVFLVRCDGTKVVRDIFASVPDIKLHIEGGWLWSLDVVPGRGLVEVQAMFPITLLAPILWGAVWNMMMCKEVLSLDNCYTFVHFTVSWSLGSLAICTRRLFIGIISWLLIRFLSCWGVVGSLSCAVEWDVWSPAFPLWWPSVFAWLSTHCYHVLWPCSSCK